MTPEDIEALALSLPDVTQEEPYGPHRPVYKVGGSIFAMLAAATPTRPDQVTVKCEPHLALHLCEQHAAVRPWYQGRRWHWITVSPDAGTATVPSSHELSPVEPRPQTVPTATAVPAGSGDGDAVV